MQLYSNTKKHPFPYPVIFMWPNPNQSPNLPRKPGESGEMLAIRRDVQRLTKVNLFGKVVGKGWEKKRWALLGVYELSRTGDMSFTELSEPVGTSVFLCEWKLTSSCPLDF
jgi:hypothetical protein